MTRILWATPHSITPKQREVLSHLFSDPLEIIHLDPRHADGTSIAEQFKKGAFDDLVFMGAFGILTGLLKHNILPLRIKMRLARHGDEEEEIVRERGRQIVFDRFQRVVAASIQVEELVQKGGNTK